MANHPDPDAVTQAVIDHFARQLDGDPATWTLAAPPRVREMPWSTLYFLNIAGPDGRQCVVAKIVHFPDQTAADVSWKSEELRLRGRREYESMARVHGHFAAATDCGLRALRPLGYLPEMNIVLMEYAAGVTLYDACAAPARLLTPAQRRYAHRMMHCAGQWLRHLHTLPLDGSSSERLFGPAAAYQALLEEVERLRQRGVDAALWPRWEEAQIALREVASDQQVWTHGDFHMRNLLILPGGRLLGFDTALERIDSPFYDVGKFIADMKTRRARILRGGLLPGARTVERLCAAFLDGYLGGQPLDRRRLALYEGRFFFAKWNESLDLLDGLFGGGAELPGTLLRRLVIDPTFGRMARRWTAAAAHV
jgi:hypothetical protein